MPQHFSLVHGAWCLESNDAAAEESSRAAKKSRDSRIGQPLGAPKQSRALEKEYRRADEQCQTASISCGGKKIDACCTTSQCRYEASDGTVFNCNGTDCQAAAQQAARWCVNQ